MRIGDGAAVGALSLVTRSVPDWRIVAGVPARVVKARSKGLWTRRLPTWRRLMSAGSWVGATAERQVLLTEELIRRYADLVDDHNPLHLDADVAAASRFKHPVVHGMLLGSLFSGLISTKVPGPGSIYVAQTLRFLRPVLVGDRIVAKIQCIAADEGKGILTLTTTVAVGDREYVVGEATVLVGP